jgi:polysaccharide export outer membrane protein
VIRELPGEKHIAELNLTNPDVIQSPYYYILPLDIVYVEHQNKVYGNKNLRYRQRISLILSVIYVFFTLVKFIPLK